MKDKHIGRIHIVPKNVCILREDSVLFSGIRVRPSGITWVMNEDTAKTLKIQRKGPMPHEAL